MHVRIPKNRTGPLAVAFTVALMMAMVPGISAAGATPPAGNPATYTLDTHFDEGTRINVNYTDVADQLQLDSQASAFDNLWIAASARGTIVKIDTNTGTILGEYQSAPDGHAADPSRTTVEANGGVWAGNRADNSGNKGSVVHIGLLENGGCVDRNLNGVIDTSTGLGDIKPWLNPAGVDDNGGVSSADDECIIHYTRTNGTGLRTLAIDENNDVWTGGLSNRAHEKIDGITGLPVAGTQFNLGCGGYGGLYAGGVLWSARELLRYDTVGMSGMCFGNDRGDYGLGIDPNTGHIWQSSLFSSGVDGPCCRLYELDGAGNVVNSYPQPFGAQGVVVDQNSHVWVAEIFGSRVAHYAPDPGVPGTHLLVGTVTGFAGTTGVAVDANGFIWASEINSSLTRGVAKIDPNGGPIGAGGYTVGAIALTIGLEDGVLPPARPYNYSDMTGSTLIAPPTTGTWEFVHDSGLPDAPWSNVSWNADEPGSSSIMVEVASSNNAGGPFSAPEAVTNGVDLTSTPDGQFLKVTVMFDRANGFDPTPVLFDLTLLHNRPPDCTDAAPSLDTLWPPNHKFVDINVLGVTDPDGDPITITIDSIWQDEPTDTNGDGTFTPDGMGVGTDTAELRAERSGTKETPGNGRVYHVGFTADDGIGGTCNGLINVGVPHDVKDVPIDEGALFDSTN